jgi:hypothetical protein
MLSTNRIAVLGALLLAACAVITTLSNGTDSKVAAKFEGSVEHEGVSAHSFTIDHEASVEVTLTGLRLAPATKIGMGLGTPTAAGNCALVDAMDSTEVSGTIAGTLKKGTYCVAVYDSGDVASEPLDYTVSVTTE